MKVVAFNGSPRKDGNTAVLIDLVLNELKAKGIETELISLAGKNLIDCQACRKCKTNKDKHCSMTKDEMNGYIDAMLNADGIIIGSPVYFSNYTSNIKSLIDRAGYVAKGNDDMFKRKVGAAVVAARRAGSLPTFDSINHFFLISQMIVPGSSYWNMGFGLEKGDVKGDAEGVEIMKNLGRNMAWLLKKLG
ncbi:MAG: flavodoxin family protein [Deltaproteobacteria bacterium]|uniref:Flavodoxin family protein n=1 Tax=Candidatus Zymogenus saltonus TaxID=2844893 RepID=A0A9D8PPK0_9DELT|nr:flavodoxin family protein [Candidatus Zymogenus saltonus]